MTNTAEKILRDFDTIAVVGLSRDPAKAAHSVPAAMRDAGFRIIPVNPVAEPGSELLGQTVFRSLGEAAEAGRPIEVVNVFRPSPEAAAVTRDAVRVGAKAVWLQLGITSAEARELASRAGMLYVEDECMAVVRARLGIVKHAG
ncbi:CoA-binding protein [Saccharomonospora glauca]|jgi:predicted CoA-binding protein|uniref:Putative CoA-binding protein n=1 Tax=Saccharomonospora glauca K62 TaxID=928724 RepID=I1D5L6_9PSEU|nr:CoA-binding protein [Saccharomonospora glauca]EIF00241.1 putative CoA-binding protein [Saccharomonospora glauca K62]